MTTDALDVPEGLQVAQGQHVQHDLQPFLRTRHHSSDPHFRISLRTAPAAAAAGQLLHAERLVGVLICRSMTEHLVVSSVVIFKWYKH